MKHYSLILCILVLAVAACTAAAAAETAAPPKAVVLDLSIHDSVVDVVGSRVVQNYPPDNRASRAIVIRMLDGQGSLLAEQGIDDPRIVYIEEGATVRDSVNFSVIVPFRSSLATIALVNGTSGAEIVSADVSGTVKGYCTSHGSDPDCAAPVSGALVAAIVVAVVLLAGAGWFLLKRREAPEQKPPAP